jgi:hypothetical protein
MKNTIKYDRKGLHNDFEIFRARCLGRFFGFSLKPKQPITYNEFSGIEIAK